MLPVSKKSCSFFFDKDKVCRNLLTDKYVFIFITLFMYCGDMHNTGQRFLARKGLETLPGKCCNLDGHEIFFLVAVQSFRGVFAMGPKGATLK